MVSSVRFGGHFIITPPPSIPRLSIYQKKIYIKKSNPSIAEFTQRLEERLPSNAWMCHAWGRGEKRAYHYYVLEQYNDLIKNILEMLENRKFK